MFLSAVTPASPRHRSRNVRGGGSGGVSAFAIIVMLSLWTGSSGVSASPVAACPAQAPAATSTPVGRVVAIGDIHGDFDALTAILHRSGLIDANGSWTGGSATLVQTGDFMDRGPQVRAVIDLLMRLQEEAPKTGGKVIVLLGNHEAMTILGDRRDQARTTHTAFADEESETRRNVAFDAYAKFRERVGEPRVSGDALRTAWMDEHAPGFFNFLEAFGPDGTYGRWLRERPVVVRLGNTIFLHGGIHPSWSSLTVEAINRRAEEELEAFDEGKLYLVRQNLILPFFDLQEIMVVVSSGIAAYGERRNQLTSNQRRTLGRLQRIQRLWNGPLLDPQGPLWFRGYAHWTDEEGASLIAELCEEYGVERFVVGHTPQLPGRIRTRFGGKIFLIDTGMLSAFYHQGEAAALDLHDGKATAIYLNGRSVSFDGSSSPESTTSF